MNIISVISIIQSLQYELWDCLDMRGVQLAHENGA